MTTSGGVAVRRVPAAPGLPLEQEVHRPGRVRTIASATLRLLGDTEIGEQVNVGAGTITCNYDGANKHKTIIEDHAFIGSNTALVAPVRIGRGATVGAGSAIGRDVPDGSLGLTRAPQKTVKDWRRPAKSEKS